MAETTEKAPRRNARPKKRPPPPPPVREALPLRGRIPSLSPAQAAALRGLFAAPQGWTLRDDGVLQFMPGRPAPPAQTFELDAEGARIGLGLRTSARAGGMHWSDYHGRSRVLAWSLAHEAQLMRLSEAFGIAFTPIPEPDGAAQDGDALLWLDFIVDELADDDTAARTPALQGALRMPADWSERLLQRADPPYDDAPPALGRWRELGVPFVLQWSIAPLPLDDWASLRPGDVILAGRRGQPPQAMATARGLAWPLAATAGGW
ncbi:MAG TPA: hypothetical protein PLD19_01035, partial [Luteimonas sp.]|nr:hypothetical protein [Luteimonas sp.]